MKKRDEITDPKSCLSKAGDDERIFVLRAKDAAAPYVIRAWIEYRIAMGKNNREDAEIIEAGQCATLMEIERKEMML